MKQKWVRGSLAYLLIGLMMVSLFISPLQGKKAQAEEAAGKISSELAEKLDTLSGSLGVIVTFNKTEGPGAEEKKVLENIGITNGIMMESLPMAGVTADVSQIKALASSPAVRSIHENKKLKYLNADATELTGVDKVRTDKSMQKANGGMPFTGKGVGVVVNDSGVDGTHKDHELGENLVQNVMGSTNLNAISGILPISYTENVPNTDTNSGHGTHVAGTVGGTGAMSGGKYEGAAPGADMIGYGSGAALFVLDGIGGFDYALTHQAKYNIRIITNSWGSSGGFDPNDPINIASKMAYDRGITVLFAAGNEGPGENTHNPYAKAPWVISVAAGEKDGTLADFSSRGTKGAGGTFTIDGEEWTWEDRPTVTAPGVDIISTRVIAPVSSLAATDDIEGIDPAHLPYYTTMSGTSMATPHAAGVAALMLEANPSLSPGEIKEIFQETATNMPGYETWEAGAGYLNAYAAVDTALNGTEYGATVNSYTEFNSTVETQAEHGEFTVDYNPLTYVSDNAYEFEVPEGIAGLSAKVFARGLLEETGNPLNLVLISPDGTEYSSGISLLFSLYPDRTVSVSSPVPGPWKAEIRGLRGTEEDPLAMGLPETVKGTLTMTAVDGFAGLEDIEGHPAESAIKLGIGERLFDGKESGVFEPDSSLTRMELAKYLTAGAGIRQTVSPQSFTDVDGGEAAFSGAVTAQGAALKPSSYVQNGVMLAENGQFNPDGEVSRAELAYSLIQSLGLENEAEAKAGDTLTVQYGEERLEIEDSPQVPDEYRGYVQLALDLNVLNAYFQTEQGPYDLEPVIKASFKPESTVNRGDFAVAMTRFYHAFLK
ncbi:S8 family peptidase [Bacillus marinisedimentorum]|uniref:S8 family peptidase n=1 Tax=Bacillus marinisedimentorum TaxID=1821260 RepID=UPI000872AB5B|nr:S8 family serine peptidase [Bacillus marinisedimentorum]